MRQKKHKVIRVIADANGMAEVNKLLDDGYKVLSMVHMVDTQSLEVTRKNPVRLNNNCDESKTYTEYTKVTHITFLLEKEEEQKHIGLQ